MSLPAPFIVGSSRSGTTLLRLMFDAHPALAIPPETHFLGRLPDVWRRAEDPAAAVMEAIVASERWPDFELDASALTARIAAEPPATLGDLLRTFYGMYAAKHGKPRWGDKTPQYVLRMPQIAAVLPEARFVHVIRDGRDVALSVIPMWFGPSSIEEAAQWWAERIRQGRRDGASVTYTETRFEQLVATPEAELRRLCGFLGLEYDEAMLGYHDHAGSRMSEIKDIPNPATTVEQRARLRARTRAQLSRPPEPGRVGRWRLEMSRDDQRRFAAVAGDVLEELGYPR